MLAAIPIASQVEFLLPAAH